MFINDILTAINDVMYTYILVVLLVGVGIYFTIRTKGVQFRLLGDGIKSMLEKSEKNGKGEKKVSSFQALMISTASRVGTGNIAGIATAIAAGGPGAVFWMWIMAIVGGALMPPLQGMIIDMESIGGFPAVNFSFILPLVCFGVVTVYGYRSYKARFTV